MIFFKRKPLSERRFTLEEVKEFNKMTETHARRSRRDYNPAEEFAQQLDNIKKVNETFAEYNDEQREAALDALQEEGGSSTDDMLLKLLTPLITGGLGKQNQAQNPGSDAQLPQEQAPIQEKQPLTKDMSKAVDMIMKKIPAYARNLYKVLSPEEQQKLLLAIHERIAK